MRLVFMGSAPLACACLARLFEDGRDTVCAVVTQPDRPKGRHLRVTSCPVTETAREAGLPILSPLKVNDDAFVDELRVFQPDLIVVVAYGQILGRRLLALPPKGAVNVHASLLPKYRGAAPIQWAVASGERVTGVTTMFMNEQMDAGDIILQREVPIDAADTAGTLHDRLADAGAALLAETLEAIRENRAPRRAQNPAEATLAPKLRKVDGRIDWRWPADMIVNRVRGFHPWPGCYAEIPAEAGVGDPGTATGRRSLLKVITAAVEPGEGSPGQVIHINEAGPLVAAGQGAVRLLVVQPEGRTAMSGGAYLHGRPLREDRFLL